MSLGAEVWGEGKGQNICGPASFSKIPVEGVELPSLGPVPPATFLALPGTPTPVSDSSSETLSKRHGQVPSPLSSSVKCWGVGEVDPGITREPSSVLTSRRNQSHCVMTDWVEKAGGSGGPVVPFYLGYVIYPF